MTSKIDSSIIGWNNFIFSNFILGKFTLSDTRRAIRQGIKLIKNGYGIRNVQGPPRKWRGVDEMDGGA